MWSGHVKGAVSSLRRSRWRTIFTMMGIIIGISSVVTLVSLGEGLKRQVVGQINELGSNVVTVRPGRILTQQGGLNLYAFLAPSTLFCTKKLLTVISSQKMAWVISRSLAVT
jgi:ABC-type antimicrobial peptide transport system permease subunit